MEGAVSYLPQQTAPELYLYRTQGSHRESPPDDANYPFKAQDGMTKSKLRCGNWVSRMTCEASKRGVSVFTEQFEQRNDQEKIQSQWNKLIGLHSREEWSAAIVRAATAAEIAANFAVRQEFKSRSKLKCEPIFTGRTSGFACLQVIKDSCTSIRDELLQEHRCYTNGLYFSRPRGDARITLGKPTRH
jgi:hypothetical protein